MDEGEIGQGICHSLKFVVSSRDVRSFIYTFRLAQY